MVYADVVSSPICYNERSCWISFFHDVTERKRARRPCGRAMRKFRPFIEACPSRVILDSEGKWWCLVERPPWPACSDIIGGGNCSRCRN